MTNGQKNDEQIFYNWKSCARSWRIIVTTQHTRLKCNQALKQTRVMCGKSNYKRCSKKKNNNFRMIQTRSRHMHWTLKASKERWETNRSPFKCYLKLHFANMFQRGFSSSSISGERERKRQTNRLNCLRRTCLKLNCGSEIKTQYYILLNYEYFVPTPY